MAIEWSARMNQPFTIGEAAQAAARYAAELLAVRPADLTIEVLTNHAAGEWADPGLLSATWEPAAPSLRDTVFVVFHAEGWYSGICQVMLSESMPRHDDPESGLIVTVTSARDDQSILVSIATVCAFAEVGGGAVIDDRNALRGEWEQSPADVVARIGLREPAASLDAAVVAVLRRTALGGYAQD